MAIHGGLRNTAEGRPPQPALLVSVRDIQTFRDSIDDLPGEIEIAARALLVNPANWQYSFSATHAGVTIATGRVAAIAQGLAQDPG
jgi:hypothetical protein